MTKVAILPSARSIVIRFYVNYVTQYQIPLLLLLLSLSCESLVSSIVSVQPDPILPKD